MPEAGTYVYMFGIQLYDVHDLSLAQFQTWLVPRVVIQSCAHMSNAPDSWWWLCNGHYMDASKSGNVSHGWLSNKGSWCIKIASDCWMTGWVLLGQWWQNSQNLDGVFLCWCMSPNHGRTSFDVSYFHPWFQTYHGSEPYKFTIAVQTCLVYRRYEIFRVSNYVHLV